MKEIAKGILFLLSIFFLWRFAHLHINENWHILVGWISCSVYNAIFDFNRILNELE